MNVQDYVTALPDARREIAEKLVPLIEAVLPGKGAVWHGHPVWSLGPAPGKTPVCLIKAYSSYVTFALWRGQELADPRLTPAARQMAGVKIRTLADIDPDLITTWLTQAQALEA
ncbi:DUF1801 domain-containing protein [Spirillospora sp. NPDC047279]|uniref:DUF1801 domain-containing protein n=1 Tax=Spirillospora sp. NPDC047279 TaxID=3155478 RepID=UPI003404C7BA